MAIIKRGTTTLDIWLLDCKKKNQLTYIAVQALLKTPIHASHYNVM